MVNEITERTGIIPVASKIDFVATANRDLEQYFSFVSAAARSW